MNFQHAAALFAAGGSLIAGACSGPPAAEAQTAAQLKATAEASVDAGRYLATIGGCHDCHTPGWNETYGQVPEARVLTGTNVGWRGPWGTTYPSNLRLLADGMTEEEWVEMLRTRRDRPPMPWMNLNRMKEADARAVYRYLKALGPAGQEMPAGLPPGVEPTTPFIPIAPPTAPARSAG